MKPNLLFLFVMLILLTACTVEKQNPPTPEETLRAMQEYILVSGMFSDAFEESNDAAKDSDNQLSGKEHGKNGFPVVSIEPFDLTTWPKTITADYGNSNFLCIDGRYRRGKIIITASDFYRNEGSVHTVNFDEYFQNDHKLEGTQTIINQGRNTDEFLVYDVEVSNGKVTTPDAKIIYFEQNSSRTWIEGEGTIFQPCDDVYLIDGTQNGISSDSINYTITVVQSLNVLICCKWIRSGILNINIEQLPVISIDYGETQCDNQATVSFGGTNYPVVMQ